MPAVRLKLEAKNETDGSVPLGNRFVTLFSGGRVRLGSGQIAQAVAAMLGLAGPLAVGAMAGHLQAGMVASLAGLVLSGEGKGETTGEQAPGLIYATAAGGAAMLTGLVLTGHTLATAFGIPLIAATAGLVGSISRPLARATTQYILYTIIAANLSGLESQPLGVMLLFLLGACWTAAMSLMLRPLFKGMDRIQNPITLQKGVQLPKYTVKQRLHHWRKSLGRLSGWQYVIRISACLAAASALELIWPLRHGYWVSITVVIVVHRNLQTAMARAFQRAVGTVFGVLVISLLLLASPPMWVLLSIIAALAAARPILLENNYTAYAAVMTPLVILLLDFGQDPSLASGVDRLMATLAGCGLALTLGYLGWSKLSPLWAK